ncbi:hypothetical protein Tco_0499704 [Tanacetum coccineum]
MKTSSGIVSDEDIDKQKLEAHYSYMAKISETLLKIQFYYSHPLEQENKTILKQLKKANASLTQELKECKTNLDETSRALWEATSSRDSCLIATFKTKRDGAEKSTPKEKRNQLSNVPSTSKFSYLADMYNSSYTLFDSGCHKAHDGNLKLLSNVVEKFMGTVRLK